MSRLSDRFEEWWEDAYPTDFQGLVNDLRVLESRLASLEPVRVADRLPTIGDATMINGDYYVEAWQSNLRRWHRVKWDMKGWINSVFTHWRRIDNTPPPKFTPQ